VLQHRENIFNQDKVCKFPTLILIISFSGSMAVKKSVNGLYNTKTKSRQTDYSNQQNQENILYL